MRFVKLIFVFLFAFSLASVTVYADSTDLWEDLIDTVPEGSEIPSTPEQLFENIDAEGVIRGLTEVVERALKGALAFLFMLIGIGFLITLSENIAYEREGKIFAFSTSVICTASAVAIFLTLKDSVYTARDSIISLNGYFESLTPLFGAVLIAGGNVKSAGAQVVNMNVSLLLIGGLCEKLLLSLSLATFAFSLLSGLDGGGDRVQKGIKSVFYWALGITTASVAAISSLQSVIATAQDGAAMRAAKYAASGLIPVVGSSVSGALATIAGGLAYVKSAIGVGAVILVIGFISAPLVTLLLYRAALSIAASFMELVGSVGGVRLFSAFRSAEDTLIATYTMLSIVYILQIVLFIKSGVNAFG